MLKKLVFLTAVIFTAIPSIGFSKESSSTKKQLELVGKIKGSKSAIEQAKYYKQLWNSLKVNAPVEDPKITALKKQRDKLNASIERAKQKYSLSTLRLFIDVTFYNTDYEDFLKKEIAHLEQVGSFIGRIEASLNMKKAFSFAKKSKVKIELSDNFKVDEQGSVEINFKATDEQIIEFLLGPQEPAREGR